MRRFLTIYANYTGQVGLTYSIHIMKVVRLNLNHDSGLPKVYLISLLLRENAQIFHEFCCRDQISISGVNLHSPLLGKFWFKEMK